MNISCFTELNYTQISAHFHTCVTASTLITLDTSASLNQHFYLLFVNLLLFGTFANSRWLHVKYSSKLSSTKTNRHRIMFSSNWWRFFHFNFYFLLMQIQQSKEKEISFGQFHVTKLYSVIEDWLIRLDEQLSNLKWMTKFRRTKAVPNMQSVEPLSI